MFTPDGDLCMIDLSASLGNKVMAGFVKIDFKFVSIHIIDIVYESIGIYSPPFCLQAPLDGVLHMNPVYLPKRIMRLCGAAMNLDISPALEEMDAIALEEILMAGYYALLRLAYFINISRFKKMRKINLIFSSCLF